ncbi:hypothetical protein UlMin_025582 [Ulmus minor]
MISCFESFEITHIPRTENSKADRLAQIGSGIDRSSEHHVDILLNPSTEGISVNQIDEEPTWMTPIIGYLLRGELPRDKVEARTLRMRAARYTYLAGQLYKRGYSNPLLKCITANQGLYVMQEIHEGVCRNHNIVCGFGIPHSLVSDNGTQFDSTGLKKLCSELGIKKHFSSVAHPQSNGQVEAVNKTIKRNLERKLEGLKNAWVEELPRVLWAYRTTSRTTTGESPFSITYGTEAVIPVEAGEPSSRWKQGNCRSARLNSVRKPTIRVWH